MKSCHKLCKACTLSSPLVLRSLAYSTVLVYPFENSSRKKRISLKSSFVGRTMMATAVVPVANV